MKKKEIPKPRLTHNCYSIEKKQNKNINIFNYDQKLTNNDNYFNIHKKIIMLNELNISNENKIHYNNLKSKKIQKKQPERKTIGLRNNVSHSYPNIVHNMTDCNLESHLSEFRNNICQTQDIPSLTGGNNNKGKVINDNLKINSETVETKQKNFTNPFKELSLRDRNHLNTLNDYENIVKIELVNENIPMLNSKIEQINEILEKQDKEITTIFKKDDNNNENNKNNEDIINLKILNKYLQETINKNNEKINYLQEENQKYKSYKSKYLEMKKNYDTLLEEHIKMKNDLKINNLNKLNINNNELKEKNIQINNNKQNFENLNGTLNSIQKDMQELIKENYDLKKENWKLKNDITNNNGIIELLENEKDNLKLLIKGSYSEANKSIFNSYNNYYNYQEVNNLFSSTEQKELFDDFQKWRDDLNNKK